MRLMSRTRGAGRSSPVAARTAPTNAAVSTSEEPVARRTMTRRASSAIRRGARHFAIAAAASTVLTQGALEGSNTDMASAMVDMIDAQRTYQLTSKAIQTADQMMEIANGVKR